MKYSQSAAFDGDFATAMDFVTRHLLDQQLRVSSRTSSLLVAETPATAIATRRPLTGAGKIRLQLEAGKIHLSADLTGIQRLQRGIAWGAVLMQTGFVLIFGIGMGVMFGRINGIGFGAPFAPGWTWFAFVLPMCVLPFVPWLILTPVLGRFWERQSMRSLERLLADCVRAGESRTAALSESVH